MHARAFVAAWLMIASLTLACKGSEPRPGAAPGGSATSETAVTAQQASTWGASPILIRAQTFGKPQVETELLPGGGTTIRFAARVLESYRGDLNQGETLQLALSSSGFVNVQDKCLLLALDRYSGPAATGALSLAVAGYETCSEATAKVLPSRSIGPAGLVGRRQPLAITLACHR
jgi:hypothetical protein